MEVLVPLRSHGRPGWRCLVRLSLVLMSAGLAARELLGPAIFEQAAIWAPWLESRIHALAWAMLIAVTVPHMVILANEWLYGAIKRAVQAVIGPASPSGVAALSVLIEILIVNLWLIASLETKSAAIPSNQPKAVCGRPIHHER